MSPILVLKPKIHVNKRFFSVEKWNTGLLFSYNLFTDIRVNIDILDSSIWEKAKEMAIG